jgi:MoaA/NifB/PqqE/SkfB family radical SAM enzyme
VRGVSETLPVEGLPVGEESHRTKGLLRLTMACNERCPFCNVPAEDYERLTPSIEETRAELQRFLDDGAQTLTISGGEPTLLRKRLIQVVREARASTVRFVELQTNAVLITPGYARELADAGVTSAFVSFLSHVPEHHDTLAGLAGAFPKCLAGIDALLDVGIRVTLNPVTARLTEHLVPDYIDFVAERLPRVRFISMSAVQPHGRAREQVELLPDYDVLRRVIPEARRRAEAHGIELVNPYCGLPLCVGWEDAPESSVEAFEAEAGGWRRTPGLDNLGNKSHGEPCRACALRTRCGGAWHAYWEVRGGSGIGAPAFAIEPWSEGAEASAHQHVVRAPGGPTAASWAEADARREPTVWLWTDRLEAGDTSALLRSRVTDLALDLDTLDPVELKPMLTAVRRLVRFGRTLQPQTRIKVHIGFRPGEATNPRALVQAASLAAALGVDGVRILAGERRWQAVADLVRASHPGLVIDLLQGRPLYPLEAS